MEEWLFVSLLERISVVGFEFGAHFVFLVGWDLGSAFLVKVYSTDCFVMFSSHFRLILMWGN